MVAFGHASIFLLMPSIFRRDCTYKKQSAIANCGQKHDFIVPDESAKQRLDVFLASMLTQHSRSFVSDLCENGKVTVNEKPRAKNHKVIKGDKVCVDIDIVEDQSEVQPENIALDILYEDNDIIAINKPNGMVVHPAPGSPNGTFVNALLFHLGDEAQKLLIDAAKVGGNSLLSEEEDDILVDLPETPEAANASPQALRPGIVHRLDKGTSGVLLAGKHPEAVAKLSALFAQRKVRKVYLAVCVGHPGDTTIFEPIGRSQKNRQLMTVYDGPPGKPALTHVRTLAFDGKLSAALVRIETGRTHQIRVHLKERRTPIIGDEAYGNGDWNKKIARSDSVRRPLLHAYETEFTHPFTRKQVLIRAPVPDDMSRVLRKLTVADAPLLDAHTSLLTCTTEVRGREPGEKGKGYVPSDRLRMQEEDWTSIELPETLEELQGQGPRAQY